MKLDKKTAATLVKVLNAQSGVARYDDKDAYKTDLASVADHMKSKTVDDKITFTGGIKPAVYSENKDNAELVAAAATHLEKSKARTAKAAEKAKAPAAPAKTKRSVEEVAKDVLAFLKAATGVKRVDPAEFRRLSGVASNHLEKGKGLKKESYTALSKVIPEIKDLAKAFRAHLAEKTAVME